MSLTVGNVWHPQVLVVGHGKMAGSLRSLFHQMRSKLFVETDPTVDAGDIHDVTYGRDLRICRLDGSLLIPYGFSYRRSVAFDRMLRALYPLSSKEIINGLKAGIGKGCDLENVEETARLAKLQMISYTLGKSAIEGGNCFLFAGADGKGKGVVGVHSLILTLIALQEQGYFEEAAVKDRLVELEASYEAPSEECLRMARNLSLYAKSQCLHDRLQEITEELSSPFQGKSIDDLAVYLNLRAKKVSMEKELQESGGDLEYRRAVLSSLSDQDTADPELKYKGIELEAKLTLAKMVMAEELKIDVSDLTIVPQVKFHIDFELFPSPDGKTIFVHDEKLVAAALEAIPRKTGIEQSYLETSRYRLKEFGAIYEKTVSILQKQGFEVKRLPGIFDADGKHSCFLMNGVFVPCFRGTHFLTNDIESSDLPHEIFAREFEAHMPGSQLTFLKGDWMEDMMTDGEAGIHCLTWEQGRSGNTQRFK